MAIRDKMWTSAGPFLQQGENRQAIFAAQTISGWWSLLSVWIIILKGGFRVIVVTDRRILVCRAGRLRTTAVKGIVAEFSRATRIGPAEGLWYQCDALGERLFINKRFHKDIAEADRLGAAETTTAARVQPTAVAAWYADPYKRHQMRYWNGSVWTENVADNGRASTDVPAT